MALLYPMAAPISVHHMSLQLAYIAHCPQCLLTSMSTQVCKTISQEGGRAHPTGAAEPPVTAGALDKTDGTGEEAASTPPPRVSPMLRPTATSSPCSSTCGSAGEPGSSHPHAPARLILPIGAMPEKTSFTCVGRSTTLERP